MTDEVIKLEEGKFNSCLQKSKLPTYQQLPDIQIKINFKTKLLFSKGPRNITHITFRPQVLYHKMGKDSIHLIVSQISIVFLGIQSWFLVYQRLS